MKTKLYLPYTGFTINERSGEEILAQALLSNGPAYKIVVHESPGWRKVQEEILTKEFVEIIDEKESERIKEECDKFFFPVIETLIDTKKIIVKNGTKWPLPPKHITVELRRALSYIIIGNRKKAWIYGDECITEGIDQIDTILANADEIGICEEGMKRVNAFKNLLDSYIVDKIDQLSETKDAQISHHFLDLLDNAHVKELSEYNFRFGIEPEIRKLKRDVKNMVTLTLQNLKHPYLLGSLGLLSYVNKQASVIPASFLILGQALRNVDLREYAPPMKKENLFNIPGMHTFSCSYFNESYPFYVEGRAQGNTQTHISEKM